MASRRATSAEPTLRGSEARAVKRMLRKGAEPDALASYLESRGWEPAAALQTARREDQRAPLTRRRGDSLAVASGGHASSQH